MRAILWICTLSVMLMLIQRQSMNVCAVNSCPQLTTPAHGSSAPCANLPGHTCQFSCDSGYILTGSATRTCNSNGVWTGTQPQCNETHQAKTLLASELHYLADQCTEEMHVLIASNFIALYTLYLGTIGDCDGNEECTIENVQVECGEKSVTLRIRDIADGQQASKAPVTVKFAVKVPLPSNASVVDLNQTTQQISRNILASLNEIDLTLNISGVVLEYDASKPPVVRIVGLVCDKGQVLKGTKCVNCTRGYFFNTTGCQPCAVDQYQDQEGQTSCVPCPSGTSTLGQVASKSPEDCQVNCTRGNFFNTTGCQPCAVDQYQDQEGQTSCVSCPFGTSTLGQVASKSPEDCQERRKPTTNYRKGETIYLPIAIVVGSLILITLIVVATVLVLRRLKSNGRAGARRFDTEENMGRDNLAYGQPRSFPDNELQMKVMVLPQHVQQPDVGFRNPHIDPGGHCQTLDNANGRSENFYPDLFRFSGATDSQSEIEDEVNPLDSLKCSKETLHNHLPTSFPKYITKQEATFTSTGGELCAPLDSDVRIIVPSGAIPVGKDQPVFFGVFLDETTLLRDIPEATDRTLISPEIECGPHDIHLSKPVEIIVPHCLCLSEAKKEWITVYKCGKFSPEVEGHLSWERVPIESEKSSQSKSWFTVEKDSIRIKTTTFSLWSIFACGGPTRKRATVFASRPDPKSDLIYLRFYVYSDNEDSKRRVGLTEKERFPDSRPAREKPFRMYNDSKVITVKLANLEEGWKFDKTNDTQIYHYEKASGNGFRSKDACDFAVKPEDGRDVNGFSCMVTFQQEDDDQEYSIYLNPGFTPWKRQSMRRSSAEGGRGDTKSSSSQDQGSVDCDHYIASLGSEPVTEEHIYQISPDVGRDWKDVLRSLSMKEKAIENLSEDYKHDKITEQCIQGLLKWKELDPQLATIKKLAIALRHVGCFDALETLRNYKESNISDF